MCNLVIQYLSGYWHLGLPPPPKKNKFLLFEMMITKFLPKQVFNTSLKDAHDKSKANSTDGNSQSYDLISALPNFQYN